MTRTTLIAYIVLLCACTANPVDDDGPLDDEDGVFIGTKADGLCIEEGSIEADAILSWIAMASFEQLDDSYDASSMSGGAGLHRTAAENIVSARPLTTLEELDAVSYVGNRACGKLEAHVCGELGLCTEEPTTCSADEFEARPSTTRFTASCLAQIQELRALSAGTNDDTTLYPAGRCEDLSGSQRQTLDWAALQYDSTPQELTDDDYEFNVGGEERGTYELVAVDSYQDGINTTAVFQNGEPLWIATNDGLATDEHWTCGEAGEEAINAPWGACFEALIAPACDSEDNSMFNVPAGPIDSALPWRIQHALQHLVGSNDLDESFEVRSAGCESRATVELEDEAGDVVTYEMFSAAEDESFVLTVDDADGPSVVCEFDFAG